MLVPESDSGDDASTLIMLIHDAGLSLDLCSPVKTNPWTFRNQSVSRALFQPSGNEYALCA